MRNHFRPQKSFMRESRAHNSWSGLFDHFEEAGRNFRRVFSKKKKINSCNVSKRRRIKKLDQWNWSNFDPVWKHPLNTSRTFFLALLQNSLESLFRNDSTFHTRTIPTLASSSSFSSFPSTASRSIRGSPTIRPPLLKTRAGEWGDSRWSFSMDLHYLQTGFSRCEIKIGASHQWSHLRLDRSASKKAWKGGGLPLERRTTRAGSFDVFTRHMPSSFVSGTSIRRFRETIRKIEDVIPLDAPDSKDRFGLALSQGNSTYLRSSLPKFN